MFGEFRLLAQVLEFVWKACQAYAATPEGQKELQDIADAEASLSGSENASGGMAEGLFNSGLDAARAALRSKK